MNSGRKPVVVIIIPLLIGACGPGGSSQPETRQPEGAAGGNAVSIEEVHAIARDGYVFGFPMVMGYKTLYKNVVDTKDSE